MSPSLPDWPTLWIETEDVLRRFNSPGVQRVCVELIRAGLSAFPERVRLCRLSSVTGRFAPVEGGAILPSLGARGASARAWNEVERALARAMIQLRQDRFQSGLFEHRFESAVRPGDILLSLGASWNNPSYPAGIERARSRLGMRFGFLLHDIIPLSHPQFAYRAAHVKEFGEWLRRTSGCADFMLTQSEYNRLEFSRNAAGPADPHPDVDVIRFGSTDQSVFAGAAPPDARARESPPFVLFVSTIEARKNHRLMISVWRRLIERNGPDAVPTLVFAGRVGRGVEALMDELRSSGYLGGKVVIRSRLSDAAIGHAYRSCLFSVFPSLCEGWGLPVAESLSHGAYCVASNRGAIPEVGGDLVDYFDPDEPDDALAAVTRALREPGYVEARKAEIRRLHRPPTWAGCLGEIIATIDRRFPTPPRVP